MGRGFGVKAPGTRNLRIAILVPTAPPHKVSSLLLAIAGMSENTVQGMVEGKMHSMDAERRVRRNVSWLLHFYCL